MSSGPWSRTTRNREDFRKLLTAGLSAKQSANTLAVAYRTALRYKQQLLKEGRLDDHKH